MKKIVLASALALCSLGAFAQDNYSVYVQGGTEGAGIGLGYIINQSLGVRGEINGINISHSFTSGANTYNANASLKSFDAYLDYFPFDNSFRLTTGLVFSDSNITGNANGSNVTINGTNYTVGAGQSVNADVKFASVAPYLGIGFGHSPRSTGLSVFGDIGVFYANPTATLNVSPGLASTVGAANIAAEQSTLQGYANNLRFYPVAKLGVSYAF